MAESKVAEVFDINGEYVVDLEEEYDMLPLGWSYKTVSNSYTGWADGSKSGIRYAVVGHPVFEAACPYCGESDEIWLVNHGVDSHGEYEAVCCDSCGEAWVERPGGVTEGETYFDNAKEAAEYAEAARQLGFNVQEWHGINCAGDTGFDWLVEVTDDEHLS